MPWSLVFLGSILAIANGIALPKRADISSVPPKAWSALNTTVGGKLHAEYPMGAFCYAKYQGAPNPHVDLAQCVKLQTMQTDSTFVAQYAQGYVFSTWPMCISKNQTCNTQSQRVPADPITPLIGNCEQGSVPNYYIDAKTDSDIQAGLAFANKYAIPLVIKASGHDYKGRSAGQGALKLWTYNYKPAMQYSANFIPIGASKGVGPAITIAAGHDMDSVLQFADQHGGAVISGSSKSVVPGGGYVAGGGHSPLSPAFGLAVDNAYQISGILANGTKFIASRQNYPDLFYALRGGGGSTFAVATQVTMRLIPTPSQGYQFAEFALIGLTERSVSQLLKVLIANAEKWANDGWGGYAFPSTETNHTNLVILTTPKLSLSEAKASLAPLTDFIATLPEGNIAINTMETRPNFLAVFNELANGDKYQGTGVSVSSRLVPVDNFRGAANQQKLFDALYPIGQAFGPIAREPLFICITTPYGYNAGADANTSSITPAWRKSLWHVIAYNEWDPNEGTEAITSTFKHTHDVIQPLIEITPGSGAYQNEADVYETDPVDAFWGKDNYNKLLNIKKQYDPDNLFTCRHCIGWDQSDERFSCYPDVSS